MKNNDLPRSLGLPVFPWDLLTPYRETAAAYPDGAIDLSIGTPVDDCPQIAQSALQSAANAPGYPVVIGSPQLRSAIVNWARERGITCLREDSCLPTVGSKELVANLGWQLGIGAGDKILFPEIAYPTYDICARLAGAQGIPVINDISTWPCDASLVWINTPANPTGWVASRQWLREVVSWAREVGAVVASDECYSELTYAEGAGPAPSLLQEDVCGGSSENLLLVYSVSKESNLAGYRAAFIAGDPKLISALIAVRKHSGQMMPAPVQAALTRVLLDRSHVGEQVARYARRRKLLAAAVQNAGLKIAKECVAGLYLWVFDPADTADAEALPGTGADWRLLDRFAHLGLIVAPESFYNSRPGVHVRVALCVNDDEIEKSAKRLVKFA